MKYILKLIFIFLLIANVFEAKTQIYSFEDGVIPAGSTTGSWSTSSGKLVIASNKYKLGTKSIRWNWVAGSILTINNPYNIASASTSGSGGITLWVYNTAASTTNQLIFSGLNSTSTTPKCSLNYNLNFKGWRCLWAKFVEDMHHDNTALNSITIQAPLTGSGTFYFDYVEFPTSVSSSKNSDSQCTVIQSSTIDNFLGVRNYGNVTAAVSPTSTQLSASDTIIKRLDAWFLSKGLYSSSAEMTSRKNSMSSWINGGKSSMNSVVLKVDTDGAVTGNGLLYSGAPSLIDNSTAYNFLDYTNRMLPIALDYRLNATPQSKTQLLNMFDWFYDQGYADGSGIGSLMYEKLGISGYIHSVFLMRDSLGATRLTQQLNFLNWISMFGSACTTFSRVGDNADEIRTMVLAKLYAAVLQTDPNKRVTALSKLTAYYNNAFAAAPGFSETFKPDFSGYHHLGPYLGAYYKDALYSACLVCYLLHNTPYALSTTTFNQLKNSLLTYRLFCGNYDVPSAANGRFPGLTTDLSDILPAFAYLALSQTTPDTQLLAAFKKYWTPTISPVKEMIADASIDIAFKRTLGEIELCLAASKSTVVAETPIKTSFYLPYAGILVNRSMNRLSTIKGYSQYIWGFESVSPSDNLYGRYMNFGQIEYTSLVNGDGRRNNAYNQYGWDWSRLPGTTSKHLNKTQLNYVTSGSNRIFSDQSFLGGVALNDSTSLFSVKLHDCNYNNNLYNFDPTFYANKSVFCFGNALICLGSKITNNATSDSTETTLLQHVFNTGETFSVNGVQVTANKKALIQPIIRDNLGNSFIVKTGSVNVYKTDTLCTAVISHGIKPTNSIYAYYMLLQSTTAQDTKYSNASTSPIQIIRQDTIAHIVKQKTDKVWGYSIFNTSVLLNDSLVQKVNTPSIVLIKAMDATTFRVVVSDPDMHRIYDTSSGVMAVSTQVANATPFAYQITLNGIYQLAVANPSIVLTVVGNTTNLAFNTQDGNSYTFDLKNAPSTEVNKLIDNEVFSFVKIGLDTYALSCSNNEPFDVSIFSIEGNLIHQIKNIKSLYELNTQLYSKGVYVLKLQSSTSKLIKKIIIN